MKYRHPRTTEFATAIFEEFANKPPFAGYQAGEVLQRVCGVEVGSTAYGYAAQTIQHMVSNPAEIPLPGWCLKKVSRRYQFKQQEN